jgi:hypothetical protein
MYNCETGGVVVLQRTEKREVRKCCEGSADSEAKERLARCAIEGCCRSAAGEKAP